jgi:aldehyde:ferredoxin oxidoreductase
MTYGYTGQILHVNLSTGSLEIEHPQDNFYRKYIGGSMMGMYYILRDLPPGSDPYGPENVLTFMISPLTGAPVSGQSRMAVNARSPLVDGIGDSQAGGFFPAELKFAGFDGIVIRGRAEQPVYLYITEGKAELLDARHLWGKTTSQVDVILKTELGDPKIEIAQCGPAGEKLVRLAAVINMANRANGRTGMGAVMGSKNLKAIAARGRSKKFPIANPTALNEMARGTLPLRKNSSSLEGLHIYGTASGVAYQQHSGGLPTRNYNSNNFAGYDAITGEAMADSILVDRDTCYACSVRCKRVVETEWQNLRVSRKNGGPEYETIATFGSYCAVDDLEAIAVANMLCNEFGLDTIGTGATVAWAMECFEAGLLSEQEVGFALHFGDAGAMVRLTEMLARREGIGDILAEGSRRAADILGIGHDYLIAVKGAELPAHMPQAKRSLGLIYAVNPFGADHQSSEHDPDVEEGMTNPQKMERLRSLGIEHPTARFALDVEKIKYAIKTQHFYSFLDSASLCQFVFGPTWSLYGPVETLHLVRTITGWKNFDIDELLEAGERRVNMMRLFNMREGLDANADRLPAKIFKPLDNSSTKIEAIFTEAEFAQAKKLYYQLAGWDEESGNPREETLLRLGLNAF